MSEQSGFVFDADPNESFEPTPEFEIGGKQEAPVQEEQETPVENETTEDAIDDGGVADIQEDAAPAQEPEEVPSPESEESVEEEPVIEEIIEEIQDIETDAPVEEQITQTSPELPEGVNKLVEFMNDTGGTLEDYIQLNRDFDKMSDEQLLLEYYSQEKPHWTKQEIMEHLEDEFEVDEYDDVEDLSREDRRKLRLKKEEIFKAKKFLEGQKEKYYENLKFSSQQNATQSDAQAKAQAEAQAAVRQQFEQGTQQLFGEGFQGFVFEGGDGKKFRIREQGSKMAEAQMDLNNVFADHVNEDGSIKDLNAYHQALYAFQNYNKISQHFYQQGKADALKERAQTTKNIDMAPKTDNIPSQTTSKPKLSFVNPPGWD